MLELNSVRFSYEHTQYQFDLTAQTRSTTAIMGKSGSGKSTLLNLIAGFLKPESGNISWQQHAMHLQAAQDRPVTTLFQQHNLFPHLTIKQNLALGIKLSGGEQQRVALARCLLRQKPILLMDEPFSALDEATRETMQALTLKTIQDNGLCAIIVTHNPEDAAALNANTYTINDGRLHSPN